MISKLRRAQFDCELARPNGDGYFMAYDGPITGTGLPSDLTIYSRIEGGPDNALRSVII
jgi:hypothetical protein